MKHNPMRIVSRVLSAVALLFAGTTISEAQTDPLSDWLRVYDPSGNIYAEVSVLESQEVAGQIYYIDDPNLIDLAQFGNYTALIEPGGNPNTGPFSDSFGIASVSGGLYLAFSSDTDVGGDPFGIDAPIKLFETGGIYDATMYLSPQLRTAGYTAAFWSDTEQHGVPDAGATIGLLGLALTGLGLLRKKVV